MTDVLNFSSDNVNVFLLVIDRKVRDIDTSYYTI